MTPRPSVGRINILSIDGGGIRGIIPAAILAALRQGVGSDLHEVFDLICGTSTGGIIALGIGTPAHQGQPYRPEELVAMYVAHGPAIFRKRCLTGVRELLGPKYSPRPLEKVLQEFFGDTEFRSALTPLLVSSYDLQSQQPFFFKSHHIAADRAWNWPVRLIARATSAAPTFFPPLHLRGDDGDYALVDGGVFVNNPAMAAYAEARRIYSDATEFYIVSVGTGARDDKIMYRRAKCWGLLGWARQIVPVMMDSVSGAVDYELDAIVGGGSTHKRLQPRLGIASADMDDASPENLKNLQDEAAAFVDQHQLLMSEVCAALRPRRGSTLRGTGAPAHDR
jgi:patatin-like phospholipase/acyl hydrolase